jgi:hypothetical protein
MNIPELDKRTKKDIVNQIRKASLTYTPEWRFDEENPDVGTALSLIYANMMSDTINRYNRVLELNRVSFFNKIGAKLLPAIPAKGYVTFGLVNQEVPGVEVRKGTKLSADVEGGESVAFETVNDLYVTPASLDHIYLADSGDDRIIHLYEKALFDEEPVPFHIFDTNKTNLQTHEMYFCHDSVLNIEHEAWIVIHFFPYRTDVLPGNAAKALLDPDKVRIEYYSEEGYTDFAERRIENGELWLLKEAGQPGFELTTVGEKESYFIRLAVNDVKPFGDFRIESLALRSNGSRIEPELVNADGIDQKIKEFYPFGERPSLFTEVYFVSKEVLCKRGAMVNFSFTLDFARIPLEIQMEETPIKWKYIMKRSEFKPDVEYDISIEEVSWEYYNGEGWSRLYVNNQYAKLFSCEDGKLGETVTVTFQCPKNICPFLINSVNSYSIRARILKMNNLYKMKGNYITPIITNPYFKYDYIQNDIAPSIVLLRNNLEERSYTGRELYSRSHTFEPFYGVKDENLTMYLGFEIPPLDGPIKILFSMLETINAKLPRLIYEYYGGGRWQTLSIVDETEKMRKTGVITMIGSHDFMKKIIFGRELYWIRIIDAEKEYHYKKHNRKIPCICGIYMNSTQVEAVETMQEERFTIEPKQENKVCTLLNRKIYKTSVWVNEIKSIYDRDRDKIEQQYNIRYDRNASGQLEAIWVNWTEAESFALSDSEDRHYVVDRINGTVTFSDGRNGKIPSSGANETILVEYSCGGGVGGNVDPGKIQTMDRSIGFINMVTNHEITTGGCDQETVTESLQRNAAAIKHGYRAVTTGDYEALALEATRNIMRAKCIANCNSNGEKEYGSITLVILQKDFIGGRKFFDSVKAQVINYIEPKMSNNLIELGRFHVVEPRLLEINVYANAVVKEFDQVFDVKNKVLERIKEFIDPISGNFDHKGWEIGTLPNSTQILNALKEIKEILFVRSVRLAGFIRAEAGMVEVDLDREDTRRFVLPISGKHDIYVEVK